MDILKFNIPLLKTAGFLTASFGAALGAAFAIESTSIAIDQSAGLPRNEKCEAQLLPIAQKLDAPLNGSTRYNPWLRQCSYVYAKKDYTEDQVSVHKWFPDLNFISK